jgi:hypothetical protein
LALTNRCLTSNIVAPSPHLRHHCPSLGHSAQRPRRLGAPLALSHPSIALSDTMADNNDRTTPQNPAASPKDIPLRLPPSPQLIGNHRQSFAENLRGVPPSPRAHRQPSLSQTALQELLKNPPTAKHAQPEFAGRDWRTVQIGEITSREDVRFVEMDTSVEAATNV